MIPGYHESLASDKCQAFDEGYAAARREGLLEHVANPYSLRAQSDLWEEWDQGYRMFRWQFEDSLKKELKG